MREPEMLEILAPESSSYNADAELAASSMPQTLLQFQWGSLCGLIRPLASAAVVARASVGSSWGPDQKA